MLPRTGFEGSVLFQTHANHKARNKGYFYLHAHRGHRLQERTPTLTPASAGLLVYSDSSADVLIQFVLGVALYGDLPGGEKRHSVIRDSTICRCQSRLVFPSRIRWAGTGVTFPASRKRSEQDAQAEFSDRV